MTVYSSWDPPPSPIPDPPLDDALGELVLRHWVQPVMGPGGRAAPLDCFFGCTRLRKLEVLDGAAGCNVPCLISRVPVEELVLDYSDDPHLPGRGPVVWGYCAQWHLQSDSLRVVQLTGRVDRMLRFNRGSSAGQTCPTWRSSGCMAPPGYHVATPRWSLQRGWRGQGLSWMGALYCARTPMIHRTSWRHSLAWFIAGWGRRCLLLDGVFSLCVQNCSWR